MHASITLERDIGEPRYQKSSGILREPQSLEAFGNLSRVLALQRLLPGGTTGRGRPAEIQGVVHAVARIVWKYGEKFSERAHTWDVELTAARAACSNHGVRSEDSPSIFNSLSAKREQRSVRPRGIFF